MAELGVILSVLASLAAAVTTIGRDRRFTRREVWIQASLIALFVAASVGLTTLVLSAFRRGQRLGAVTAGLAAAGFVGGLARSHDTCDPA